ncbi:Metal-dependent hydrolase [Giardia muris]|uniref:Metal-dependent hydrolase n=1 Tax=Giardia muris TaxID=5742 RepID=A0A4Z1SVU4_GIAMU|nr:Metal-dependent hydrolase [Giardia muris]|eukprot:TNJ27698.1 Metal-dependent hydrolase [Giardia muris]
MALHVIGSAAGVPAAGANTCGVLLEYLRGSFVLYDCPEGTSRHLLAKRIPLSRVEAVIVSHMHADHVSGLVGFLSLCASASSGQRLPRLFGPDGLQAFLDACEASIGGFPRVRVERPPLGAPLPLYTPPDPADSTTPSVSLLLFPLKHVVPSLGLCVLVGPCVTVLTARALEDGVRLDQLRSLRTAGTETVTIEVGGRQVPTSAYQQRHPARRYVLISDNCAEALLDDPDYALQMGLEESEGEATDHSFLGFARRAGLLEPDLLLHELTYLRSEAEKAAGRGHSHTGMVLRLCEALRPKLLLLNHFSPRYRRPAALQPADCTPLRPTTAPVASDDPIAQDWFEASKGSFPTVFGLDGAVVGTDEPV